MDKDAIRRQIERQIDGDDHDRQGYVEVAQATAANAGTAVANLVILLIEKKVIAEDEVSEVLEGIW